MSKVDIALYSLKITFIENKNKIMLTYVFFGHFFLHHCSCLDTILVFEELIFHFVKRFPKVEIVKSSIIYFQIIYCVQSLPTLTMTAKLKNKFLLKKKAFIGLRSCGNVQLKGQSSRPQLWKTAPSSWSV